MTLDEYQKFTQSLAVYNEEVFASVAYMDSNGNIVEHEEPLSYIYPVLALAEEAGEVAGKVAKYIRKHGTDLVSLRKDVQLELGDVMYQLSETARQFGLTLDEIMQANVDKLQGRKERGTIVGEGDIR